MYNRYIPQPDGSYRRRSVTEQNAPQQPAPEPAPTGSPSSARPQSSPGRRFPPPSGGGQPCRPSQSVRPSPPQRPGSTQSRPISAGSFLKQLLPKNLDTEDLLVVILLLLMAGDNGKDPNSALLTLALYLFL